MGTIADFKNKYDEDLEPFSLKHVNLQTKVLTYHHWLWSKSDPNGSPFCVEIEVRPDSTSIYCTWK